MYYIANGAEQHGPFNTTNELIASGLLNPTSLVWKTGMTSWVVARELAELKPHFQLPKLPRTSSTNQRNLIILTCSLLLLAIVGGGAWILTQDYDKDGTADYWDDCPYQAAAAIDKGCPGYANATQQMKRVKDSNGDSLCLKSLRLTRLPKDIQHFTNLKKMDLSYNIISDISLLLPFKNLVLLDLNENQLHDVAVISQLTQLKTLKLFSNELENVYSLSTLTRLQKLYLGSNKIRNVANLQGLKELTVLDLDHNEIETFDLDLRRLPKLKELHLYGNPIKNIPEEVLSQDYNCLQAVLDFQSGKSNTPKITQDAPKSTPDIPKITL